VAEDALLAFLWMAALVALIKFKTYPDKIKAKLPSKRLFYVNVVLALSGLFWFISTYLVLGLQSPFALATALLPLTIIYLNVLRVPEAIPINLVYFAYLFYMLAESFLPHLDPNSGIPVAARRGTTYILIRVFAFLYACLLSCRVSHNLSVSAKNTRLV
jgi:hypothetical protein